MVLAPLHESLSHEANSAPESGIVEVMNYGRDRPGMIPLWAGEGDLPTPDFICAAASRSLDAGETFYTWQRGIPELREALARYHESLYGQPFSSDRFFVTGSGMQAIQIAARMVAGQGDEVLVPTPAWPNIAAALGIAGATPIEQPMRFGNDGWVLDIERLSDSITPRTTAIFLNSPSNPTGWVASLDVLRAVLDLARKHGLWIIADEVYARFYYGDAPRAPSFYDIAEDGDRILFTNTFSKNWAMTGWRLGWLAAPPELGQMIENLIQYSTSGVAAFMQRAAVAALDDGEAFLHQQVERARAGRQCVCSALEATGKARFAWPDGAFYLFFAVDGYEDTSKLGLRLVDEANIGLAPGSAFAMKGAGFMRLCFARRLDDLEEASRRLVNWLGKAA